MTSKERVKRMQRWTVINWIIVLIVCVIVGIAEAGTPTITIKAGRYYMTIDGIRKKKDDGITDKYWGLSTTAEAAAINWAFETGQVVTIEQPSLTVTAFFTIVVPDAPLCPDLPDPVVCPDVPVDPIEPDVPVDPVIGFSYPLTWSPPEFNEDGTSLNPVDIVGYSIMVNEVVVATVEGTTQYTIKGLTPGVYEVRIATITYTMGQYSEPHQAYVGE